MLFLRYDSSLSVVFIIFLASEVLGLGKTQVYTGQWRCSCPAGFRGLHHHWGCKEGVSRRRRGGNTNSFGKKILDLRKITNRPWLVFEGGLGFLGRNKALFSLGKEPEGFWKCVIVNKTHQEPQPPLCFFFPSVCPSPPPSCPSHTVPSFSPLQCLGYYSVHTYEGFFTLGRKRHCNTEKIQLI